MNDETGLPSNGRVAEIRRRYARLAPNAYGPNHPAAHVLELLDCIDEMDRTNAALRATLSGTTADRVADRNAKIKLTARVRKLEPQLSAIGRRIDWWMAGECGADVSLAAIAIALGREVDRERFEVQA